MALNLVSILEIIFVLTILPGAGFALTAGLILWKRKLRKYVEGFTAAYLGYFLLVWLTLDTTWTSTPVLGFPLGNSPVMLVVYTVFGLGMLVGVIAVRAQLNNSPRN